MTVAWVKVAIRGSLPGYVWILLSHRHTEVGMPAPSTPCDWVQSLSSSDLAPGKKEGLASIVTVLGTPKNSGKVRRPGPGGGGDGVGKSPRAHPASWQVEEPLSSDCPAGVGGGAHQA